MRLYVDLGVEPEQKGLDGLDHDLPSLQVHGGLQVYMAR